jgi:catechol 2,3-dioxygenase-like lactoylglutathione lyase family enzyme
MRVFPDLPMSFGRAAGLGDMTNSTQSSTSLKNIGVAMFTIADQDAAIAFYTDQLGFELRADVAFGEHGEMRWVEVAPPGSTARLALNPPMFDEPGGSAIGVETADVLGEYDRLAALGGIDLDDRPTGSTPGAPLMFMLRDPDGNTVVVVEEPPAA